MTMKIALQNFNMHAAEATSTTSAQFAMSSRVIYQYARPKGFSKLMPDKLCLFVAQNLNPHLRLCRQSLFCAVLFYALGREAKALPSAFILP